VSDIIVVTMAMCIVMYGVKITTKKASFSRASIVPTIGNFFIFTIEGKWLEIVMGMLEANFFV